MRKRWTAAVLWPLGVLSLLVGVTAVGRTAPGPAAPTLGPAMRPDTGAGEMLVIVLGGVFATREEAQAANVGMTFGDVQGYYVVPVAQFQGFREQVGVPGDHALVSVFRTEAGAEAFATFARSLGHPAQVLPTRVRSLGGLYAGLGQEAAPDGGGPLVGPVPASLP
jgi:hypothetical protein